MDSFNRLRARTHGASDRVLAGIALIVKRKGAPPYDVLTVAALRSNLGADATPEMAQRALDALLEDKSRTDDATSGSLLIVTDVGLRGTDGFVDTDDRQMLLAVLALCAESTPEVCAESTREVTVVLKKTKDQTTPSDVVEWVCAQRPDARRDGDVVCIGACRLRVFQLTAPPSLVAPKTKLAASALVDADAIAALRAENAGLYDHIDAIPKMRVLVCGPMDVALAQYIVDRGLTGYSICSGSGINGGDSTPLDEQYANCGGRVLKASALGIVDFEPKLTRKLQIPLSLLYIDSEDGIVAAAENSLKTAAIPMLPAPVEASEDAIRIASLVMRITQSNNESTLGSEWFRDAAAHALRGARLVDLVGYTEGVDHAAIFRYAATFALALVVNQMLANGTPIGSLDEVVTEAGTTWSSLTGSSASSADFVPRVFDRAALLPPKLAQIAAVNLPGIPVETTRDLFIVVMTGMAARLTAVMEIAIEFGLRGIAVSATTPSVAGGGLRIQHPIP
jgi:hypothetical protein